MSSIQFNEEPVLTHRQHRTPDRRGIVGWLLRKGWVPDVRTAQLWLIGIIAGSLLLTAILFFVRNSAPSDDSIPHPDDLILEPGSRP